jgi:hypothetical protein
MITALSTTDLIRRCQSRGHMGKRAATRRLALEVLEDRTLLSASLILDGPQTLVPLANVNVSNSTSVDHSEMTVTINPANPLNIAGFSHYIVPSFDYDQIAVYYSLDGGNSWAKTLIGGTGAVNSDGLGSNPSNVRFDPTIKFDGAGNLFVGYGAYTANTSTTKLIVAKSADGGATFANTDFRIIDSEYGYGGIDKYYLAVGPADASAASQAIYIAYDRPGGPIYLSGSKDEGTTFTAPSIVISTGPNLFADPAVGPNGELYVSWQSYTDGTIKVRVKPDGLWGSGGWNPATTVRTLNQILGGFSIPPQPRRGIFNAPTIDVDRSGGANNGRAYVTWVDRVSGSNTDVYLSYSDDLGATWSPTGGTGNVENDLGSEFHAWVQVDQSSGSVSVLYRTNDGSSDTSTATTRVASSFDGGQTFPSKADIADQRSRASSASYAGDFLDYTGLDVVDGTIHAFWSDNRGATAGTYTSYLNSYSVAAAFVSATGTNTLVVNGDDAGPTDDTIIVRHSPANSDYVEVQVNGQTQYAGLLLSVNSIVVNGLSGNNVLVVQGDFTGIGITLNGGDSGRNLMIAGLSSATLNGGNGENILIGGTTQWDYDPVALAAIMAEWTRTDLAYADRVDHLLNGGGLNGAYLLNATTVTGNGAGNTLLGGAGLDLYFGNLNLDYYDWDPNTETFVSV